MMGFVMDDKKVEEKWKFVPEPTFCYLFLENFYSCLKLQFQLLLFHHLYFSAIYQLEQVSSSHNEHNLFYNYHITFFYRVSSFLCFTVVRLSEVYNIVTKPRLPVIFHQCTKIYHTSGKCRLIFRIFNKFIFSRTGWQCRKSLSTN